LKVESLPAEVIYLPKRSVGRNAGGPPLRLRPFGTAADRRYLVQIRQKDGGRIKRGRIPIGESWLGFVISIIY